MLKGCEGREVKVLRNSMIMTVAIMRKALEERDPRSHRDYLLLPTRECSWGSHFYCILSKALLANSHTKKHTVHTQTHHTYIPHKQTLTHTHHTTDRHT